MPTHVYFRAIHKFMRRYHDAAIQIIIRARRKRLFTRRRSVGNWTTVTTQNFSRSIASVIAGRMTPRSLDSSASETVSVVEPVRSRRDVNYALVSIDASRWEFSLSLSHFTSSLTFSLSLSLFSVSSFYHRSFSLRISSDA